MRFSDEFLAEIKNRNDIVDIVSSYVDLRTRGPRSTGLCPFHNEKSPSFTVFADTQSYYCFGCSSGGDVITFIKNIENIDYGEAVKLLADKIGLPLPADGYDDSMAKARRRMLEANREAARFFHNCLFTPDGQVGLEYYKQRALSSDTIRRFGLGFAPDKWDALVKHLKAKGFSESEIIAANLALKTKKGSTIDRFRNRAIFPIIDVKGSVLAFGGRRVVDTDEPKYVNTSDTLVYKKGNGVFGLNLAKNGTSKTLILCEGYMDVIAYHQAGFTNAVAGLGTAFSPEMAKLIAKYADEVILSYDNDEAGQKAASKAIGILSKTPLRIRVAILSGGKDSDEIITKYGKEKMRQILDSAVSDVEYKLMKAKKGFDLTNADDKIAYLNSAVEELAKIKNPIHWDVYASKLSAELGVSKDAITIQINKKASQLSRRETKEWFAGAATFDDAALKKANPERQKNLSAARCEEMLISSLLKNPDFYFKIKDKLSENDFSTQLNLRLFKLIASKLESGRSVDVTYFAQDLTDDEMGYLVRLESMRENLGNTVGECLDCIKRMKEEKALSEQGNPANMTDSQWAALFKPTD